MEIEESYLAKIFEGDQLFVLSEESDKVEFEVESKASNISEVKEPKSEKIAAEPDVKVPSKEVVILLKENLSSAERETLLKLLKAIDVEESQYEIIYRHPEQLKSIQHLKLFLSFHNHYVQSDKYSVLKINKGNAIYAHDLSDLNQDTSKKVMLWNLLKSIV